MIALAYLDRLSATGVPASLPYRLPAPFRGAVPATTRQEGYKGGVELLRFLSALGIVWFHLKAPGASLAYAALPVFLVLSAYCATSCVQTKGGAGFLADRATRILVPWLAWCGIYLALQIGIDGQGPSLQSLAANPFMLLVGPMIHLWYLPFLFAGTLLVPWLVGFAQSPVRLGGVALGIGAVVLLSGALLTHLSLAAPFGEWLLALPGFGAGILLALAARHGAAWGMHLFLGGLVGLCYMAGYTHGLLQLVIAVVAFRLFWSLRLDHPWLVALGRLSFGIYLVHPIFVAALYRGAPELVGRVEGVALVFAASVAVVAVLRQIRQLRWLV